MLARIGFIWAIFLFFLPTAFGQGGGAEQLPPDYRVWDMPVVAQDGRYIVFVFSRHDGDAFEVRDKAGTSRFRVIHMRYQGQCWVGVAKELVMEWSKTSCRKFLDLEEVLRGAIRRGSA